MVSICGHNVQNRSFLHVCIFSFATLSCTRQSIEAHNKPSSPPLKESNVRFDRDYSEALMTVASIMYCRKKKSEKHNFQRLKLSNSCRGQTFKVMHRELCTYYLLTGFLCGTLHALQGKFTPKCPNVTIYKHRHLISRCILMNTTVLWCFKSNLKQVAREK